MKTKHTLTKTLWSSLLVLFLGTLTVTVFTVRQGEVTKTAHLAAPKDVLQFTSGGQVLGFAKTGVYVASGSHALRVEFVNSHSTTPLSTTSPSETGKTKAAPPLSRVTYPNLWDGVTLTYDAPNGAVARSNYRLEPYANTGSIRLRYNAPVSVQGDGSLRVNFQTGTLNESAPQAWQERSGKRVPVQIAFAVRGKDEITFTTGHYDRSQALFIDPTLTWNTFLGGSGDDFGNALAVDGSGNVYVAGYSTATWGSPVNAFTGGAFDNAFVAKLDSSGNLIWNTFLGDDFAGGNALAVDGSGNVYVAGTWYNALANSSNDVFAAKLDSTGHLIWNTFLGGSGADEGRALAVDGSGNVYVAGRSTATWGSPVRAFGGGNYDAFAAKLDSTGHLIWNTFLGSSGDDFGYGLAVDGSGNVYVAGSSTATWGSPVRAFGGGNYDAFAVQLDSTGNLTWNTFLGGSGDDFGNALAVDGSGNVYVAGYSTATWGSPVRAFSGGDSDAFVAKLSAPTPTPAPPTITVTDAGGNPVPCGGVKTVSNSGQCGSVTVPLTITASGNCPGTITVTSTRGDGKAVTDPYPVGSTTVTVTATDACGKTSTCTFIVTVTNNRTITSNFNGTPIPGNSYLWFNAVLKPSGLNGTNGPVTVRFFNQTITSGNFNLNPPDTTVIFDPNATCASAVVTNTGQWIITAPKSGLSGNTFLSGLSYQVPAAGLPGGIKPVSWSGTFITDTPGVSLNWQWAAAVYTTFNASNGVLGVKATDDNKGDCAYHNSDHAGTPEQYKSSVVGGATGGGGSNYTGGLSGTQTISPCDTF
jgi:hypothetical protein